MICHEIESAYATGLSSPPGSQKKSFHSQ